MTRFVRLAFLAALAGIVLRAESLNDILARMDQSARSFRTFSAKIKRTQFTKVLNAKVIISRTRCTPMSGMATVCPAKPVATAMMAETGPVTMPTAIASITIATNRIQNPPYRVTTAGAATTGEAYAGTAGS